VDTVSLFQCPFPSCAWTTRTSDDVPPGVAEMLNTCAGQHRESHMGEHSSEDWARVYGELLQRVTVLGDAVLSATNNLVQSGGGAAEVGEELGAAMDAFEAAAAS
jgi:hypothetical protein